MRDLPLRRLIDEAAVVESFQERLQHGASRWPFHCGVHHDQSLLGAKRDAHSTIAVSFGIVPVNNIANRLARNLTASR